MGQWCTAWGYKVLELEIGPHQEPALVGSSRRKHDNVGAEVGTSMASLVVFPHMLMLKLGLKTYPARIQPHIGQDAQQRPLINKVLCYSFLQAQSGGKRAAGKP